MKNAIYLSDEHKKNIGLLIKIWRQEKSINQDNFLYFNGSQICSRTTLSAIENMQVIKNDEIYYELFQRMGISINTSRKTDQLIEKLTKQVESFYSLEESSKRKIIHQISDCQYFQKDFYYSPIYKVLSSTLDLLNTQNINLSYNEYFRIYKLEPMFQNLLHDLWLHLCFNFAYSVLEDKQEMKKYESSLLQSNCFLCKIDYLYYCVANSEFEQIDNLKNSLNNTVDQKELEKELYLNSLITRLNANNKRQTKEQCLLMIDMLSNNEDCVSTSFLLKIYSNIALTVYEIGNDFSLAASLLKKCMEYAEDDLDFFTVLWIDSCERTELTPNLDEVNRRINKTDVFYKYFERKYVAKETEGQLFEYIISVCLPKLKTFENKTIPYVFKRQLETLIIKGKIKKYKEYFDFCTNCGI